MARAPKTTKKTSSAEAELDAMLARVEEPKSNLIADLELAIRAVLKDANATLAEKIQAINAGTRLATARHKISGDDEEGSFFQ
jgi:hypothetical protein